MNKTALSVLLLSLPISAMCAEAPLWLRDAKISPDGKNIAFTYKGDIYTVATSGGEAVRLTSQTSYETTPVWSPDSRTIAFTSDRHGNFDIFTVSVNGGEWTRLTYDSASEIPETFTPDGKNVMFSASIQDPVQSALFPTGRMTELYQVSLAGGNSEQVLATPARFVSWAKDGKSFLYQDVKGFEDEWRKHHTSSVTRDIWHYDIASGKHTNLTNRGGEDLNPVLAGDDIYFLSERAPGNSINVFHASVSNPAAAKAITSFKKHPVRFLSRSNNGVLCFTYDGELYTMESATAKPRKVVLTISADYPEETRKLSAGSGASEIAASPDGKSVAFIYRGNVYVTAVDYKTTKQITNTPEAESDITWGDNKTLIYTSERDGRYNIYKAEIERAQDEPYFFSATLIKESPLFKADKHERTAAQLSPDGKKLSFILDRTKLAVMDMDSKKVRELTDGRYNRSRQGRFYHRWSPDSKWIALEIVDRRHDPYTDVAIVNVEDGRLTNITNSGYFDAEPKWIFDGNALLFASERYGMRNHASWGSQMDVMAVFLNREAYDKYMLSKEETELNEEIAKLKKEAEKKDKKDDKAKDDKKKDAAEKDSTITVEYDGLTDRIVRLTPLSTDLRSAIVQDNTLYFTSGVPDGAFLWSLNLQDGDLQMMKKLSDGSAGFDSSADGKTLFLFGRTLGKLKGSTVTPITYQVQTTLDPVAEREFMFDNIYREERERFYVADMHGVDWESMSKDYRKFLPHINNNYDFAEMVSEWLGELNVSHTGGRYMASSASSNPQRTASLGALYDLDYSGEGVKIAEILDKSPLAEAKLAVENGCVIEKVNGQKISAQNTLSQLLEGAAGERTLLSIYNPATKERRDIVVKPISAYSEGELLYERWIKQRAADVDRLSNGRLGYVHISSMDDDSFRKVYSDILGKYNDREGIVIDVRWNGGGRLHEDIEVLFSGEKYFTQEIRGDETCDMPSRRWNKPSIMLMGEACYSNAHGTPWVYKHRNLGKLVGMPVPGTMTSVNWVRMQDNSLIFGIPVVGYRLPDGSFLENQQLEPDIKVANAPETIVKGEDTQLKAAVDELLRTIDSAKK